MISARLGRESTLLKNGLYIKDLSYMNRKISQIVYIDFDADKAKFHPENVIVLPRWEGDPDDRELYDLMPFLESTPLLLISKIWAKCMALMREMRLKSTGARTRGATTQTCRWPAWISS